MSNSKNTSIETERKAKRKKTTNGHNNLQQKFEKKSVHEENAVNKKRKKKRPQTDDLSQKARQKSTGNPPRKKKRKQGTGNKRNEKSKTNYDVKRKKNSRSKTGKIVTLIFDIFFFMLIIFMLAGAAIFTISDKQDKSFYGYRFYEVLTNSMKKTEKNQKGNFVSGDMVIVKVEEPKKIKVGDIITFIPNKESKETYLTHRVIRKEEADKKAGGTKADDQPTFVTQGDANNMEDPPVKGDMVVGVVKVAIPKAGTILQFVRKNLIAVLVFVIAFFLLIWVIRGYFTPEKKKQLN